MKLQNIKVPPFNSTLMGVVKGVSDFYDLPFNDAMLYGASGHGFLINIHETLCPSGPYCWNRKPFYRLLSNLGIEMSDLGFYSKESSQEDRNKIEERLKKHLQNGNPCGLVNMEYQLITGYDDTGFITSQPWERKDFPPDHLTFSTWQEMGEEIHVNFFTFNSGKTIAWKKLITHSLNYALDLYKKPNKHTSSPYYTGASAFDIWIKAVKDGHGNGHGNWWNAIVWSECRLMASKYMKGIARKYSSISQLAKDISRDYKESANLFHEISDKEMDSQKKVTLLQEAKEKELRVIENVSQLVDKLE